MRLNRPRRRERAEGRVSGGEAGIRTLRPRFSKWLMARLLVLKVRVRMTCRLLFVLGNLRQSSGFYRSFGDILETPGWRWKSLGVGRQQFLKIRALLNQLL